MAEINPAINNSAQSQEETLSIKDIFFLCLSKWYWIVISIILCLGAAVAYIKTTPPSYERKATILVKEDRKGSSISGSGAELGDLGILNTKTNVDNERLTLQSPALMLSVVKRLGLDISYYVDGRFYKETLYGSTLPVKVQFHNPNVETLRGKLNLKGDNFVLTFDSYNGEEIQEVKVDGVINKKTKSPIGEITVVTNDKYVASAKPVDEIEIVKSDIITVSTKYLNKADIKLSDKNATVLDITYTDVNIERADDFINTLIQIYNENWIKEKNQIAVSTSMFIADRLQVIEKELGSVDSDISSYKSRNLIPDVESASNLYFNKSDKTGDEILDLTTQKSMANYIRQQLLNTASKNQLLPANSGINNPGIENLIAEYNSKQLQRNSLVANSNEQNPLVLDLDQSLSALKRSIIASVDNLIAVLSTRISSLQASGARTTSQLSANPTQAKYILSVERQQKVKESLYLYLLQKREENEVSQAFTPYNTRIIAPAMGQKRPIAPAKGKIFLVALVLGIALPVGILYLIEISNTTVRGRKDIEKMLVPYLGEIPMAIQKRKSHLSFLTNLFKSKSKMQAESRKLLVKAGQRDFINEAFRVVRTNLEFMLGNDNKVVMSASLNAGSGKTFTMMNLANCFAIKGKKIAIVDLDLRKATLSECYLGNPKVGVTAYLNGEISDFHQVIVRGNENIDGIPCGTLPPNPSELLYGERLEQMIAQLRQEYDYVFLDCPPIEMLADSSIINKYVDLTLFVIRAELFERSMRSVLDNMYKDKKYKNLAMILNGTTAGYSRYGYHKYGYGYGYGYGYSKGYGSDSKK